MRLVTFQKSDGNPRPGALIDGDTRVVDFAEAHRGAFDRDGPASILSLVEGGDAALELAYEAVKKAPASAILARADVRLRATDSAAPADAGLPVLRVAPQAGLRRLTQARRVAGTRSRKGESQRSSAAACRTRPQYFTSSRSTTRPIASL